MIYGVIAWVGVVLVTIFAKTAAYVDKEAKDGVGRLIAVVIGSVLLIFALILGAKFLLNSL